MFFIKSGYKNRMIVGNDSDTRNFSLDYIDPEKSFRVSCTNVTIAREWYKFLIEQMGFKPLGRIKKLPYDEGFAFEMKPLRTGKEKK